MLSGGWGIDNEIKLWDAASGKLIRTFDGHAALVSSVAFSPDGGRVLSGSWDKTIKLWDAATGALIRTFEGHRSQITSVAISPDGGRVLSGSSHVPFLRLLLGMRLVGVRHPLELAMSRHDFCDVLR